MPTSFIGLSMLADCIAKVPERHPPEMTNEPLDSCGSNQLGKGQLIRLGEGFHDVRANVVHVAFLDEVLKEPLLKKNALNNIKKTTATEKKSVEH